MNWTGAIYLIAHTYIRDDHGVRRKKEIKRRVRADIYGTTATEFFEAGRAGLKASDVTFTVRRRSYQGEEVVEYKGKRLAVYRTYTPAADLIELHCEEKGGANV